ncbi:MAG: substrate-binding domain-containing protein, partial [Verrucomicrobiota bacterium]
MRNKQKHVGLLVEPLHGYGNLILDGIARWVHANPGWRVAVFDGERSELLKMARTWQGDGIICTLTDEEFVAAAESRDFPVVNVAGRYDKHRIPSVLGDDAAAGRLAAEYFIDRGFTHFGFTGGTSSKFSMDRFLGFQQRIEQAGHSVSTFNSPLGAELELGNWIKNQTIPFALLASSDRRATSVIQACWQSKLNVPEQVSVMGMGNYRQL